MLNKKQVKNFVYDLILDGKNCITKLTDEDKEQATALIIDGHDKFSAYEFISDADISNELPYLLSEYMKKRDSDSAQSLLDHMVMNAVKHSGNAIVDLLLEQEEEYKFNQKYEGGL